MRARCLSVVLLAAACGCSQGPGGAQNNDAPLPANAKTVSLHVPEMS